MHVSLTIKCIFDDNFSSSQKQISLKSKQTDFLTDDIVSFGFLMNVLRF